jgi:hypothetical protein
VNDETAAILREVLSSELDGVRADVRAVLAHQQAAGVQIGGVVARQDAQERRCIERGQHCSAEFRMVKTAIGKAEDTGVHNLLEITKGATRKVTWREAGALVLALLGAAGIVVGIWSGVSSNGKRTQPAPAPVVDARR